MFLQRWLARSGLTERSVPSTDISPEYFYLWTRLQSVVCTTKSVTSRTCQNGYRMDSRRSVRHLEISSESSSYCSDVRHPVLMFKLDTLSIFFSIQEAVNLTPRVSKPCVHRIFFLVLWTVLTVCRIGRAFLFILYTEDMCLYINRFMYKSEASK